MISHNPFSLHIIFLYEIYILICLHKKNQISNQGFNNKKNSDDYGPLMGYLRPIMFLSKPFPLV